MGEDVSATAQLFILLATPSSVSRNSVLMSCQHAAAEDA
jgi:hypothetical protein